MSTHIVYLSPPNQDRVNRSDWCCLPVAEFQFCFTIQQTQLFAPSSPFVAMSKRSLSEGDDNTNYITQSISSNPSKKPRVDPHTMALRNSEQRQSIEYRHELLGIFITAISESDLGRSVPLPVIQCIVEYRGQNNLYFERAIDSITVSNNRLTVTQNGSSWSVSANLVMSPNTGCYLWTVTVDKMINLGCKFIGVIRTNGLHRKNGLIDCGQLKSVRGRRIAWNGLRGEVFHCIDDMGGNYCSSTMIGVTYNTGDVVGVFVDTEAFQCSVQFRLNGRRIGKVFRYQGGYNLQPVIGLCGIGEKYTISDTYKGANLSW